MDFVIELADLGRDGYDILVLAEESCGRRNFYAYFYEEDPSSNYSRTSKVFSLESIGLVLIGLDQDDKTFYLDLTEVGRQVLVALKCKEDE